MAGNAPSYVASETLPPSRFVNIVTNSDHRIELCDAGDVAIGVTHEGSREAPIPGVTPSAALVGESCRVYGLTESCEVEAGGTIQAGNYLKPDADAKAVVCSAADKYSAIARAGAAAGELCQITIVHGVTP